MKKNNQFNILRNDATTHGGYTTGTLSLSNLSAILIDQDQVKIDLGLIHAKSAVERGIKFTANKDEVTDGKTLWVIWVTVGRDEKGPHYVAITACPMIINKETRKGYKDLPFHVNRMDDALKKRTKLDNLPAQEKKALKAFLIEYNKEMWENCSQVLKDTFK